MQFRFLATTDESRVTEQIQQAIQDVEIHEELLAEIVVADDLAATIAQVQGFPEETPDQVELGGKTVPQLVDGRVQSTVILPVAGFRLLLDDLVHAEGDVSRISKKAKKFRTTIRHELGHAKDYGRRNIASNPPYLDYHAPFRLAVQEPYELGVLLQEFIACANSAGRMRQDEFDLEVQHLARLTDYFRDAMTNNMELFLSGECEVSIREFKYVTMSGYWTILTCHAKLFGMSFANRDLQSAAFFWPNQASQIVDIFDRLRGVLHLQWDRYPDFDGSANEEIVQLCRALMRIDLGIALHIHDGEREDEMQVGSRYF